MDAHALEIVEDVVGVGDLDELRLCLRLEVRTRWEAAARAWALVRAVDG